MVVALDSIPTIDIGCLQGNSTEEQWNSVAAQLDKALVDLGFVYLSNHGIPETLIEQTFVKSREFFALPLKIKLPYQTEKNIHGYVEPNNEKLSDYGNKNIGLRESFGLSLDKCADFFAKGSDNPIPECPGFYTCLMDMCKSGLPFAKNINRLLARALKLEDPEFFNKRSNHLDTSDVKGSFSTFRTIFYSPISENETRNIRCVPHSDFGTFTAVIQDSAGGLEAMRSDGVWLPAPPKPGHILINTGDLLHDWTGGRYPRAIHRVLIPEIEKIKRLPRQSIVFFLHPDDETVLKPIGPDAAASKLNGKPPVTGFEHTNDNLYRYYKLEEHS